MPILPALDRTALRAAYRAEEEALIALRIEEARPAPAQWQATEALARRLVTGVRGHRAAGLDAFMQAYDLGSDEGVALMCLAEALLRVPDAATADALIHDKLSGPNWQDRLGASPSTFVNAATFSLLLTGQVLDNARDTATGWRAALGRVVGRLGEPVVRTAVGQAMKILGRQFVFGRTIEEALHRAAPEREKGLSHSFDMLGEGARTFEDAEHYRRSYTDALAKIAAAASGGVVRSPGISVKLSALHPRYEFLNAAAAKAALLPVLFDLADMARAADISFTIDAEEADRLELSMDIIEAMVADDRLFIGGWQGFGLALQAYQKRAVPMVDWVVALARRYQRRLMVRLVKGAYWDTEVKAAQVGGFADYPVFTRKVATDVSYLACAQRLLAAPDAIYPAFATHNANSIAAIKALAGTAGANGNTAFEFQRLHGMGEGLYVELARLEALEGRPQTPVRIYAPVGSHRDLLAYLVRRLLENGANSSFVNRIADDDVSVEALVSDPVADLAALAPRRNPAIPLPAAIFGGGRRNSAGIDLSDPLVRDPLQARLAALASKAWTAAPTLAAAGPARAITAPYDTAETVGSVAEALPSGLDAALGAAAAAQPAWDACGGAQRAARLDAAADGFEANADALLSLCVREAGKTLPDAVLELREAVDFLRFYAAEARAKFGAGVALPGPTGESNTLRLVGRGVFAAVSPWNFPLAIFTGMAAAALAAGNAVIAKPAEQTPLIAALAVRLLHDAGVPREVVQLLPGAGDVGAALVAHPAVSGVVFTGSTATARAINRSLAAREGTIIPLIAETGGQNAMIVDSSALPEQVTRDVVASAFQSAGQRCSALRVLFIQEDVADGMIEMIRGAMEALVVGDPRAPQTDVGPVIDAAAQAALEAHIGWLDANAAMLARLDRPALPGHFVAPAMYEIRSIADLAQENFGPVLHVIRFAASELGAVVDSINATGYGLTLGVHSRIDATRRFIEARARVGNLYVNRNQIGAVVESQPFGGEGLSGTGPKAGGPHYVARFATERVTCIDTTAAGGNASLMAAT